MTVQGQTSTLTEYAHSKRLIVKHQRITAAEIRELLPGRKAGKSKPSGAARRRTRLDQLYREDFEQVFRERHPELNFWLIVAILSAMSFKSVTPFTAHFLEAIVLRASLRAFLATGRADVSRRIPDVFRIEEGARVL